VVLACKAPAEATVAIIGESAPLRAERTAAGIKVTLPPAYANAEVPFALRIR